MTNQNISPKEIVKELDQYIVGQTSAKKSVAVALRNRYRRLQLDEKMQQDATPKNILMIGPTGVGKTEIARRLAKIDDSGSCGKCHPDRKKRAIQKRSAAGRKESQSSTG